MRNPLSAIELPTLTRFARILYPIGFDRHLAGRASVPALQRLGSGLHSQYDWRPAGPLALLVEDGNVASVAERVIDIVAEQLGVDKEKITPETSFVNDLGADSLDTVELVMELEEEFDINIPDDAAEKIQTVGQAIKFIEEAQNS
jgi:acyl carrier protein